MILNDEVREKLNKLSQCVATEWISMLHEIGEDPATFFQNGIFRNVDFSMSDMRGVSWKGSIINGSKFRKGDLSPEVRAEAFWALDIVEVDTDGTITQT